MNFLSHLFLSGNDTDMMIGNFIADSVKGKSYLKFRPKIQKGIILHRKIDAFTDNHFITKELAEFLKPVYRRHSGIVVDIFYDHFLCVNWSRFSDIELKIFITKCHRLLLRNLFILPPRIKGFLPVLIARNRLLSYSRVEGIENALKTMSKYTSLPEGSEFAISVLNNHYEMINSRYLEFFSELQKMVDMELKKV